MTILVSGFSSFPGAPRNPTQDLFFPAPPAGVAEVVGVCLPVEWARSYPLLRDAIERLRPSRVLMTGLAVGAECLRLELAARRVAASDRPDAVGACEPLPLGPGPETLAPALDLASASSALRSVGVPFEWSQDAGSYLCNDVFYRLALEAGALGVGAFAFLHVPLTDECVAETLAAGQLPARCRTRPQAEVQAGVAAIVDAWRREAALPPAAV